MEAIARLYGLQGKIKEEFMACAMVEQRTDEKGPMKWEASVRVKKCKATWGRYYTEDDAGHALGALFANDAEFKAFKQTFKEQPRLERRTFKVKNGKVPIETSAPGAAQPVNSTKSPLQANNSVVNQATDHGKTRYTSLAATDYTNDKTPLLDSLIRVKTSLATACCSLDQPSTSTSSSHGLQLHTPSKKQEAEVHMLMHEQAAYTQHVSYMLAPKPYLSSPPPHLENLQTTQMSSARQKAMEQNSIVEMVCNNHYMAAVLFGKSMVVYGYYRSYADAHDTRSALFSSNRALADFRQRAQQGKATLLSKVGERDGPLPTLYDKYWALVDTAGGQEVEYGVFLDEQEGAAALEALLADASALAAFRELAAQNGVVRATVKAS